MAKRLIYHIPWLIWLSLIAFLSLIPGDQLPQVKFDLISVDTLAHFLMYFGLTNLFLLGFLVEKEKTQKKLNLSNLRVYGGVILVGIIIGYSIELIQGNFIYRRYYDAADIWINMFGTIFGALFYSWIGRKLI